MTLTQGDVVLIDDELGAWRVVDVSDMPCACCGGPSVDTLHRVTGRGALYHVCAARIHRTIPPTWCQICGVDTVPPSNYCPSCDAILACGGVE